jgi:hypothetical protein
MSMNLEGRRFRDVTPEHAGDVGVETIFDYHESADWTVWARYRGGAVRLGFLVGTRSAEDLSFRYVHLTTDGETASGRCVSRLELQSDGRLRMYETWSWDSKPGSGTSVVEEVSGEP